MSSTRVYLCAIEPDKWMQEGAPSPLSSLIADALTIERRLPKGVNVDNERSRYALCCDQIEAYGSSLQWLDASQQDAWAQGSVAVTELDEPYLDALSRLAEICAEEGAAIRLGKSFFPPEAIHKHLDGLDRIISQAGLMLSIEQHNALSDRRTFFASAAEHGRGVIEVQSSFLGMESPSLKTPSIHLTPRNVEMSEPTAIDDRLGALAMLRAEISRALDQGSSVNFANQPHTVITEALRDFVYADENHPPSNLRIVYTDGSESAPFPLRCLPPRNVALLEQLRSKALRVTLISMRHLALDRDADLAWFRNREASRSRTLAEADEFCFTRSAEQFRETRDHGDLLIYLQQTGFPPAVVGFYRALVHELLVRDGAPTLAIEPWFYTRRGEARPGAIWS